MSNNIKILNTLIPLWKSQNIGILSGTTEKEIVSVFSSLGYKATKDVIDIYSTIGGMDEMENEACWRLWSLIEISERNLEFSPHGVIFSDHLIDSWCYRLKYETENESSVYIDYFDSEKPPKKIY